MRSVEVGIVHAPLVAVDAALTSGPESATSHAVGASVTDVQRIGDHAIVVQVPPAKGIKSGSLRFDLRSVAEGTEVTATSELELGLLMRAMLWGMGRIEPTMADPMHGLLDQLIPELEAEALAIEASAST